jgi:hypothetical protein
VACGDCHSIPPTTTRNGVTHTSNTNCDGCHGADASNGTHTGHINGQIDGSGASCTGCHSNVDAASLGLHSSLSGTSTVEDSDCQTCHFASFPMTTGAANSTNTYYCQACHTTAGTGPVKSALLKDGLSHGKTDCKWCHAAGDQPAFKYHTSGPKGTATGANCLTCHYTANLVDEPFRAPGETHSGNIGGCDNCHTNSNNHLVTALDDGVIPGLSAPDIPSQTSGNPVVIQATVSDPMVKIAAAQYQVTNTGGIVIPWTDMTPSDGSFNSGIENVYASIDTSSLLGTYTVNIKGMASAYKTNTGLPYYPLNGKWSLVTAKQLIITQPLGSVTGSVKDGSNNPIAGVTVSTNTGFSVKTDSNGLYSLNLAYGTHLLTASKDPEYYQGGSVSVTIGATPKTQNFILNKKPTGTISGKVNVK